MKKKISFIIAIFVICIFRIIFCENVYAATYGKTYSFLVSGAGKITDNDVARVRSIIESNKLSLYNNAKNFEYLQFNNEKGISKSKFNSSIDKAFSKSTNSDLVIFYYSGHGTTNEQHSKGLGLTLGPQKYYPYDELANKLSKVKAKKIIVIIDACFAGSFYDDGVAKCSNKQQERFISFLSSANNETSQFADTYSRYTGALADGLGWNKVVYADMNKDGFVTAKELSDYINIRMKDQLLEGWVDVNPQFYSKSKNYVLYAYSDSKIVLNSKKATIYIGDTYQLIATLYNMKGTVKWSSSRPATATVSVKGEVVAKKAGSVTIMATANGKIETCKITVKKPSIKLNKSNATIYTSGNKTIQLNATVKGSSKKVTWKSSNKTVATVNSKGKVTAKKAGTVTITAKANGVTAKCIVTVKKAKKTGVDEILDLYKAKKYSQAQKAANKLPRKDTTEYNNFSMYHEMVYAYWSISAERANKYRDVWNTYMTDIDKNGIPEYIMQYGSCEADVQLAFYTFSVKNKKACYCGRLPGGYSTFFAYPQKNGLFRRSARQGVEQMYKITLKDNKIYNKQIGKTRSVPITESYIEFPYKIDSIILQ